MKFTPILTGLLALALMMPGVASADITIDNYSAGSILAQFGAGTNSKQTNDGSILGGQRDETVTVVNPNGFFGTIGFGSQMSIAQGTSDQINGSLTYNNFGTIDLTSGGNSRFSLNVLSSDLNQAIPGVLSITAATAGSTATQALTVPASSGLPQTIHANFSDFAGIDFSQVTSLSLNFDFQDAPGRDISVGSFSATSAVPEPGSLTLLAGLAMIGIARRRRR